jgi:hypothetical protein
MPQSAAIAPRFSARYPEAAIIFDNLHSLHDVVSDILADVSVPRAEKRRTILEAAARYRDSTTSITSVEEWKSMAESIGVGMCDTTLDSSRAKVSDAPDNPSCPATASTVASKRRRHTGPRGIERTRFI